jgi:hypothetical protein
MFMKVLIATILIVSLHHNTLNFEVKRKEALMFCESNNLNTDYCILIDMSIHSGKKRLFVIDFKNNTILKSAIVSHGCGNYAWSDDQTKDKPSFSNIHESHLASIGRYRIGERGWSNWGINVNYKLYGIDSTNSNAYSRLIVLHGWDAVQDEENYPFGAPEGYGCPAVSNNTMRYLDKRLKNKKKDVLMWVYK